MTAAKNGYRVREWRGGGYRRPERYLHVEGTIHFPSKEAEMLWKHCLTGQISDGEYENSSEDWRFWCNLETVADGKSGWEANNYPMKDNYSFRGSYEVCSEEWTRVIQGARLGIFDDFPESYVIRSVVENPLKLDDDKCWLWEKSEGAEIRDALLEKYGDGEGLLKALDGTGLTKNHAKKYLEEVRQSMKSKGAISDSSSSVKAIDQNAITARGVAGEAEKDWPRVRIVDDGGKLRAKHDNYFVAFPNELRDKAGSEYAVEKLDFNGKNYRAKGKIMKIQECNEEETWEFPESDYMMSEEPDLSKPSGWGRAKLEAISEGKRKFKERKSTMAFDALLRRAERLARNTMSDLKKSFKEPSYEADADNVNLVVAAMCSAIINDASEWVSINSIGEDDVLASKLEEALDKAYFTLQEPIKEFKAGPKLEESMEIPAEEIINAYIEGFVTYDDAFDELMEMGFSEEDAFAELDV
jgi:hypothetical protein